MNDRSEQQSSVILTPFLKWPGGKRWLAPTLREVIRRELMGTYYEPFVGAGAVFLATRPLHASLSDTNPALIDFMTTISAHPNAVVQAVWKWSNSADCYSRVRDSQPRSDIGRAARFLYLNRTCWGGVFRTNQKGEFNVPFGNSGRKLCSLKHVLDVAAQYANASMVERDFEPAIHLATKGDVVYADPPYTGKGENNGFIRYNEKLFSWRDQERLAAACRSARNRGVFVVVSGVLHPDLLSLYKGWWVLRLRRHSRVSRTVSARRQICEVLLFSRWPSGLQKLDCDQLNRIR